MNYAKFLLHKLMGIDIIKVFSLNAVATLVRMCAGMISVKVIAVIIGPAGVALLGQLRNFDTILLGMANGGISNGITKYISEYKEDETEIKKLLSNALKITLFCSSIVGIFLISCCVQLSKMVFMTEDYFYVFIVFGFTIFLYTLNALLISVLNGYKKFKKYVKINITGTLIGIIYSVTLVFLFGLSGALLNAVTYQSIVFFVTLWMCRKEKWLKKEYFCCKLEKPLVKKYLAYSIMTLTTLALFPTSQMLLRGYVIINISASQAGIWEGMNHISSMYLSVITTAFSIYYLPRVSEINDPKELSHEILRCYKVVVPMLLCICLCIYMLRHFILWLLFSPQFYEMEHLFGWQLMGDMFKMSSWLLSFIMVAKAKVKLYMFSEVFSTILYIVLCAFFLKLNGIVGLPQGYLCNYILYFVMMVVIFKYFIQNSKNGSTQDNTVT